MEKKSENKNLVAIFSSLMLEKIPSFANKIYYSLGFLSMTSLVVLVLSGMILVFRGPDWWLTSPLGVYFRSIHLWATQAFILFIFLHLLIVFLTSGFKGPRKLTWVLGSAMLLFVFAEAEFGYILRGDFSSQWRALQASDLYNGAGIGAFVNNLNTLQIYGIHIVFLPLVILALLVSHYILIKVRGIAKPYRSDVEVRTVRANHTLLFARGIVLVLVITVLAFFFKSPMIIPYTVSGIAKEDPNLIATTLVGEFDRSSETATYLDSIDPYTYDTRQIYIVDTYQKYLQINPSEDYYGIFAVENKDLQDEQLQGASDYFEGDGALMVNDSQNPVIAVVSNLVVMAKSGLYEDSLRNASLPNGATYATRFISDTGVLEARAEKLKITTPDYGMVKEEKGILPPGAWWLTPIGVLNHTILANDENGDRDGAIILGFLLLLLMAYPYIPWFNRLPEKLPFAKLIWKEKLKEPGN